MTGLPKRMLFAFLPEGVGEHRLPGKYGGKRYRDAVIESLRVAGVPIPGWVQWACEDDGAKWRLATRRVALWYKPFQPRRGGGMPDRSEEMQRVMQKPVSKPKKGTNEQWEMAKDVVAGSKSGCLMLETRVAHRYMSRKYCGLDWGGMDMQEVLEELMSKDPWATDIRTGADLAVLAMILQTEMAAGRGSGATLELSPGPPAPRRTRIAGKQTRPPAYFGMDKKAAAGAGAEAGREKYWARGPAAATEGADLVHECPFDGCGQRFSTKGGLSHHILRSHRKGTCRDRVWSCMQCPRTFDDERGLTRQRPLHRPGAVAYSCCVCGAVFPGKASIRMHINHSHSAMQMQYPHTCQLCAAIGVNAPPVFATAHAYSLHRLRFHVYNRANAESVCSLSLCVLARAMPSTSERLERLEEQVSKAQERIDAVNTYTDAVATLAVQTANRQGIEIAKRSLVLFVKEAAKAELSEKLGKRNESQCPPSRTTPLPKPEAVQPAAGGLYRALPGDKGRPHDLRGSPYPSQAPSVGARGR